MDLSIVIVLLAMAAGVGLCLGYLLGHQAAHDRAARRGKAARRYLDAVENRDHDLAMGVRFHR